MNLSDTVQRLVSERMPFQGRIEPIVASSEGVTLRCDLTSAEKVGCTLTQIDLVEERHPAISMDDLVHWAEWICGRVTYLLEPLRVIEMDKQAGIALIRSGKPKTRRGEISYYELVADRHHHAWLRRYQAKARVRGSVPFPLTHEQLEVLIDDLVESAHVNEPKGA